MALRHHRTVSTLKNTDQENVSHAPNAKLTVQSRIPKRAVLGDIAANTTKTKLSEQPTKPTKKNVPLNQSIKPTQQKSKEVVKTVQGQQRSDRDLALLIAKYRNPLVYVPPLATKQPSTSSLKQVKTSKIFSPVVVPKSVNNIDENDEGKIFLVPEYVNDIYKYLRHMELQFSIQPKYLTGQVITPKMRSVLVDWLVDVQEQYHLLPETLHLCVAILDLFLQKLRVITKDKLQLVGVTAMFIACKYEETYSPEIGDFVYITDSTYSKEQILSLEKVMIRKLDFSLGRPSSIHFLRRYSKAAEVTPIHHTFAKYFLDLALLDYSLVHVRPSLVAAVASFIANSVYKCETGPCPEIWNETMSFYSSYKFSDLKPHISVLASAILKAPKSKLQAIPKKFSGSDMHCVSSRAELQSDDLKKLAQGI